MPRNPAWSRDELLLALDVYLKRGTGSSTDAFVIELSRLLNQLNDPTQFPDPSRFRNPNGAAMKLSNFARFDPKYIGVGLTRGGKLEREIWDQLASNPDSLTREVSRIMHTMSPEPATPEIVTSPQVMNGWGVFARLGMIVTSFLAWFSFRRLPWR